MKTKLHKDKDLRIWIPETLEDYRTLANAHIYDHIYKSCGLNCISYQISILAIASLEKAVFLLREFREPESKLFRMQNIYFKHVDEDRDEYVSEVKQPWAFAFCCLYECRVILDELYAEPEIAFIGHVDYDTRFESLQIESAVEGLGYDVGTENWPTSQVVEGFGKVGMSALSVIDQFTGDIYYTIHKALESSCKSSKRRKRCWGLSEFLEKNTVILEPNLERKAVDWIQEIRQELAKKVPRSDFPEKVIERDARILSSLISHESDMVEGHLKIKELQHETRLESGKLKTVHKALIKALSEMLKTGNTEITRDALVRKTNYTVGSGTVNQAYIDLKTWGIITQDGRAFTHNFQDYKQKPPD